MIKSLCTYIFIQKHEHLYNELTTSFPKIKYSESLGWHCGSDSQEIGSAHNKIPLWTVQHIFRESKNYSGLDNTTNGERLQTDDK